ncbi:hypothetical protein IW138_003214 [Coemansia sp. RSA 986]|nr:hypothetical protein IW138_003214 [Coemansia sp. RSA 986]
MTSIRVCPISIAVASAVDALDRASSSSSSSGGGSAATLHFECIAIPDQRGTKASRRVSFNLGENSVRHLPSNSAISKITQARSHKLSSSSGMSPSNSSYGMSDDSMSCCEDFEEQARVAERKAKSMLPQGASHDLLDPRFTMTALYVKNGHIRALDRKPSPPGMSLSDYGADDYSDDRTGQALLSSAPTRGVLKPFTPSPIDVSFFESGGMLGELTDEDDEADNDVDLGQLLSPPQPHRRPASSKRGTKKGGKKKRIRSKADRHAASKYPANADGADADADADDDNDVGGGHQGFERVDIPSALPLPHPIPISTKM